MCNLRGSVLPVIDAGQMLGAPTAQRPAPRLVVTERRGTRMGLAVDAVTDVGPLPATFEPTDVPHLHHGVLAGGRLVGFIALDSLLAALETGV